MHVTSQVICTTRKARGGVASAPVALVQCISLAVCTFTFKTDRSFYPITMSFDSLADGSVSMPEHAVHGNLEVYRLVTRQAAIVA